MARALRKNRTGQLLWLQELTRVDFGGRRYFTAFFQRRCSYEQLGFERAATYEEYALELKQTAPAILPESDW